MFEKVNPMHPDKLADRIAGAMTDLAYKHQENPKVATEILLGHGYAHIIAESSYNFKEKEVEAILKRIVPDKVILDLKVYPQDKHLAENQEKGIRCGDNGIFKGVPVSHEERALTEIAKIIYKHFPTDGKYILDAANKKTIICQSHADEKELQLLYPYATTNPLGRWEGGINVDTGATNRKLGSDMGQSVTGGGLHGKDATKGDVSLNIYAFNKAQATGKEVTISCAIGDTIVDGKPYSEIVKEALEYINKLGGFEKFAEWGLIR